MSNGVAARPTERDLFWPSLAFVVGPSLYRTGQSVAVEHALGLAVAALLIWFIHWL